MGQSKIKSVGCLACLLGALFGCAPEEPVSTRAVHLRVSTEEIDRSVTRLEEESLELSGKRFILQLDTLIQRAKRHEMDFDFHNAMISWKQAAALTQAHSEAEWWQLRDAEAGVQFAQMVLEWDELNKEQLRRSVDLNQTATRQATQGDYSSALQNRLRALSILCGLTGPESVAVGNQWLLIGEVRKKMGQFQEAMADIEQGLGIFAVQKYETHPQIATAYASLADASFQDQQFGSAIANQVLALDMVSRLWGDQSISYAEQASQLGMYYYCSGQYQTALVQLQKSEVILKIHLITDTELAGQVYLNLGLVLAKLGDISSAIDCFQTAENVFLQQFPRSHRVIAECQTGRAMAYMKESRYGLAEECLQLAMVEWQQVRGITPAQLSMTEYQISIALERQGKYEQSQPLLEKIIAIQQRDLGMADPLTVRSLQAYSLVLRQNRQVEAARRIDDQIQRVAGLVQERPVRDR